MNTFLAILGLFCANDHQAVAAKTPWTWDEESASLTYCVHHYLPEYQVEVVRSKGNGWGQVQIQVKDDGKVIYSWEGHRHTVFASRSDTLFVANFSPIATGCVVVAVDLASGRPLWKTQLQGLGPVCHSGYSNRVNIEATDAVVIIRKNESSGRYVEILDIRTGKTVGHRIYKDKE